METTKTCRKGHEVAGDNILRDGPFVRCRTCKNAQSKAYMSRRRAEWRDEHKN